MSAAELGRQLQDEYEADWLLNQAEAQAALDEALAGEEPDYDEAPPDLPDAESVNRALARLARIRRQQAADREVAANQIAQVNAWLKERDAVHERAEAWHLGQLERYHARLLEMDPKRKTVNLPNGTLKSRKGQPKWTVDADAFVPWAEEGGLEELVRVKVDKSPAVTALKQWYSDAVQGDGRLLLPDGEFVPGVTVEPARVSFSVET